MRRQVRGGWIDFLLTPISKPYPRLGSITTTYSVEVSKVHFTPPDTKMSSSQPAVQNGSEKVNITLIGAGTIGLSFAALHLNKNPAAHITIYDTRKDFEEYVHSNLPAYLDSNLLKTYQSRLSISSDLSTAVSNASIIQEQGPENLPFKSSLWPEIESLAPGSALLWSSTSGIPASAQAAQMRDPSRLLVVHPFNPPHVMPVLEVVPSPHTSAEVIERTTAYWKELGRSPVVLRKETPGFVANRLAFALLREAVALVHAGVIGVRELDELVETSMGPRWAVCGPFGSYAAGGGEDGMGGFLEKIGGTINESWSASEDMKVGPGGVQDWAKGIVNQCEEAYGKIGREEIKRRTDATVEVLEAAGRGA